MTTFILTDYDLPTSIRSHALPLLGSKRNILGKKKSPQPITPTNTPEDFQRCTYVLDNGFVKCYPNKETGKVHFTEISRGTIADDSDYYEALRIGYNVWKEKHKDWIAPKSVTFQIAFDYPDRTHRSDNRLYAVKATDATLAAGNLAFRNIKGEWWRLDGYELLTKDRSIWSVHKEKNKPSTFTLEFDGPTFFGKSK